MQEEIQARPGLSVLVKWGHGAVLSPRIQVLVQGDGDPTKGEWPPACWIRRQGRTVATHQGQA